MLDLSEMDVQHTMFTEYVFCWGCCRSVSMPQVDGEPWLVRCLCGAVGVIQRAATNERAYLCRNVMLHDRHHPLCKCKDVSYHYHGEPL